MSDHHDMCYCIMDSGYTLYRQHSCLLTLGQHASLASTRQDACGESYGKVREHVSWKMCISFLACGYSFFATPLAS